MFATWQERITVSHRLWRWSLFPLTVLQADMISAKMPTEELAGWRQSERSSDYRDRTAIKTMVDATRSAGSDPATQVTAAPPCCCRRGAGPLCGNPLDRRLFQPLQVWFQLPERRGNVSVHDDLVEHVAELVLHGFSQINHVLEVLLLWWDNHVIEEKRIGRWS